MYFSLSLLPLLFLCSLTEGFRVQGVAVKGRLRCGEKVLRNTRVQIKDIDRNPGDEDDLLDDKYTNKDGEFMVTGTTREFTDIEPVLYIYHDCDDDIRPCQKRITLTIPKHFIHNGTPSNWLNIGDINLQMIFPGQDRSCKH